jgi:N-acetylglutamate synthase-like GNAT family acetyltransferase
VARDFKLTRENCPGHPSFITDERLKDKIKAGYYPYGCFVDEKLIGFVSLTDMGQGVYALNNLAVLPEVRRSGYGRALLDFCKAKVRELDGKKITIGIVEENAVLKQWYAANGFIHTGTKKFDHQPFTAGFMEWSIEHQTI